MPKLLIAAVCAVLMSCLDYVSFVDPAELAETEASWVAHGLDLPERCASDSPELQVVSPSAMDGLCHAHACRGPDDAAPCEVGCFVFPSVIIANGSANSEAMRVHEITHWLDFCVRGRLDVDHVDSVLWGPDGVVAGIGASWTTN